MKDATFSSARLLALYDRISDAQDAIPRLRRFVLDLAVRGKLVEQDASDEPAAELLKRIALEKARLVKAGEIRKPKPFDPIDEPPFAVPGNWAWSPMREVTTDRGQMIPNRRFTYIDVSAINKEVGVIEAPTVLEPTEAPSRARKIVRKGDVIYSCVRPYLLNVAVVEEEIEPAPIASTAFAIINGLGLILPRFIWIVLRSPFMVAAVEETQRGQAYPAINDADFAVLPFPLPPLAEQHRIVAKVDELMALCDQLELARAGREAVRDRLTTASLARLTDPETDAETFQSHARFALQSLPTLTTRPDQIKTLRQTILNLAIRGKLVEQVPTEEPAAELLAQDIPLPAGYKRRRKILKASSVDASQGLLGPVPSTWSYLTIQDLFDQNVVVDYADGNHGSLYPRSSEFGSDGVNFVSAKDLSDGRVNWQTCSKLNKARASQLSKGWARTGDVLLTHNATVGRVARVVEDVEPFLLGTSVTFYRLNPIALDSNYFYYVLQSPVWQGQLEAIMAQTTRNQVSIQKQASFFVPLPPLGEQHRIVAKVDALMTLCDQLEASLTITAATRSKLLEALLHEALNGALGSLPEAAA